LPTAGRRKVKANGKRVIGFKLSRDVIAHIKAEAAEAECWPAHVVEAMVRERMARKHAAREAIATP
jgi:hypothetical protein